jgi:hypothetical protein
VRRRRLLKGEQLRFLLASLVSMVSLRFAWRLVALSAWLYSINVTAAGA